MQILNFKILKLQVLKNGIFEFYTTILVIYFIIKQKIYCFLFSKLQKTLKLAIKITL